MRSGFEFGNMSSGGKPFYRRIKFKEAVCYGNVKRVVPVVIGFAVAHLLVRKAIDRKSSFVGKVVIYLWKCKGATVSVNCSSMVYSWPVSIVLVKNVLVVCWLVGMCVSFFVLASLNSVCIYQYAKVATVNYYAWFSTYLSTCERDKLQAIQYFEQFAVH